MHKTGRADAENKGLREIKCNKKNVKDSMMNVVREGRREKETENKVRCD